MFIFKVSLQAQTHYFILSVQNYRLSKDDQCVLTLVPPCIKVKNIWRTVAPTGHDRLTTDVPQFFWQVTLRHKPLTLWSRSSS